MVARNLIDPWGFRQMYHQRAKLQNATHEVHVPLIAQATGILRSVVWALALLASTAPATISLAADHEGDIDFAHQVVPILREHCFECHGGHRAEGDFSINLRDSIVAAGVVEPGDADGSYLIDLVTADDDGFRMPPQEKPRVPEAAVQTLRDWIDAGLPWEAGFTFMPQDYEPPLRPRRPELPPAVDGRTNPIDRILDAYLSEHEARRPGAVNDAAFARRLFLDVLGLLPTPERLQAFLADTDPDKRARLIDEVLANKQEYAEHWLAFWNDLLRNEYIGPGYIEGGRTHISAWLYRALMSNMPFDQFVRELVAPPTPESAGFIRGFKWRGEVNASQRQELQFAQNVTQVFLGINMKCASCHDSFIDRWTLEETYALAAVYSEEPLELHRCDVPLGTTARAAWMFPELGEIDADAPRDQRLKQLAGLMTDPENGRLTRTIVNRLWHRLMGRGIIHPVDAMQTEPWNADLLDHLAVHLADSDYDLKETIRLIVSSEAYQSQAVAIGERPDGPRYVYTGPIAKRMTAEQFVDAVWQMTDTAPAEPQKRAAEFLAEYEPDGRTSYRASLVASDLLMRTLGRPNREQVVTTRPDMLTTLQALDLSNSPILADTLSRGGDNVLTRFEDDDPAALVEWFYEFALSRSPTAAEREIALALVGSPATADGVEDLLWIVIMLPEFQLIR